MIFYPLEVIWQVNDWYQEDIVKDEPVERDHENNALGKIFSLSKNFVPFIEETHKCVSRGISLKQNSDSDFQSKNYVETNFDESDGPGKSFFHSLHELSCARAQYYEHNLRASALSNNT